MKKWSVRILVGGILAILCYVLLIQGRMQALRLSDSKIIGIDRMVAEIRNARLVFVGEYHDRQEAHKAQLEIIKKLHRSGVPIAIGMEMFTAGSQTKLDRWVAGKTHPDDFIRFYLSEWNLPWPLYRDILIYARDNRIPIIGLNVPPGISRKVARSGFAALTPEERRLLPAGVTCTVDPAYMSFIRRAYQQHAGNDRSFTYFCEAQMLWNKSMGFHLKEYLERNPRHNVVVLAGIGHVMKPGIPEETFKDTGYTYKVILPELYQLNMTINDGDYLVLFNRVFGD